MFPLELLSRLIEFDLCCLGLRDLLLKIRLFTTHLNRKLLNLKVKLFDFRIVLLAILLECDIILLFLLTGDGPLFELFLVPVQLQF